MPEKIIIKSDEVIRAARGQAVVEARQPLDGAVRVLSVSATPVLVAGEVFAQEARYLGKVTFDCLVAEEDAVKCVTLVAEYTDKVTSPLIRAGANVTFVPELVNAEASVDGGVLKAVAVVDAVAIAVAGEETECIAEPDDGIYAEKRKIAYCTVCAEQSETVYVTDSVPVKASEAICSFSRAAISAVEPEGGEIKVAGSVYTTVVYRAEDGTVSSVRVVTPFVKNIPALGTEDGSFAFATACVTESAVNLVYDEGRAEITATVNISVTALGCRETEVVCDVFCADNELTVTATELKSCMPEPFTVVTDTVDGQITLPADRLAADNVMCVSGVFCTLSDVRVENGKVTAEGLIGGDIVYYNAENNAADSLGFRIPFSIPLAVHTAAQCAEATATVTDVNVRVRRESVFDVKAEVSFALRLFTEASCEVVQSVKIGEEIPRPDASIIVHIAKEGETLWQAAKALHCSPDSVAKQNDATAPYAGGEKLINFCSNK